MNLKTIFLFSTLLIFTKNTLHAAERKSASEATSFSKNFIPPTSKQGVSEFRTKISPTDLDIRYSKLKGVGTKYRQYNFWWSELESSGLSSSTTPIKCPADFQMIPTNETEKIDLGYHKYRCVKNEMVARFDELFKRDAANEMQSGIVMWSSPAVYRYPDCAGFGFGGNFLKDGCVPRDDAMDDYEDFSNFLASRYNGKENGKISHFIVWNENNSAEWFDYSPIVKKEAFTSENIEKRIDKYADMLKRTHKALLRHQKAALMYVSTDQLWLPGLHVGNFGSRWLIEGIWARLGVDYSWSIAIHPYGEADSPRTNEIYTFNNLDMLVKHQSDKLKSLGITNVNDYPQMLMIASEQGWPLKGGGGTNMAIGKEEHARQLCMAHDKVMQVPQVVAVAHNYFQSIEPNEGDINGQSGQGAFFGLIPFSIGDDLEGAQFTSTGKAFMSTMSGEWKKSNNHYCCQIYKLGCTTPTPEKIPTVTETHKVTGVVDNLSVINNQNVLSGWACVTSMSESITVHLYAGVQLVGGFKADSVGEGAVSEACKSNNNKHRFNIVIDEKTSNQLAGMPISVFGISPLGFDNLPLVNTYPRVIPKAIK